MGKRKLPEFVMVGVNKVTVHNYTYQPTKRKVYIVKHFVVHTFDKCTVCNKNDDELVISVVGVTTSLSKAINILKKYYLSEFYEITDPVITRIMGCKKKSSRMEIVVRNLI